MTIEPPSVLTSPVAQPQYDASAVTPGIVHFGFGSFHRAHQAAYIDALLNRGEAMDWGIIGVNVLPHDARMHEVMQDQGFRYTHVQKHPDGRLDARTIASVVDHLHAPADGATILDRLADPQIRIVSLTITEGGYERDASTGAFHPSSAAVLADLATTRWFAEEQDPPQSAFGFIVAALRARRTRGIPPFTVLSCDNVQGNGEIARSSIVAFARRLDAELADWIDAHVTFPNTMVDRITPITTDDDRALVRDRLGVDDAWPVVCEPFTQWVVEDRFPTGRPPLEHVGVQFVQDVAPYETMKLRLLNAAHQTVAHPGTLLGYELVDQAVADDDLRALIEAYLDEARPTLPAVPGIDLDAYCAAMIERFGNSGIRDTVARLAMDADNRLATFVLPVLRHRHSAGLASPMATLVLAAFFDHAVGPGPDGDLAGRVRGRTALADLAHDDAVLGEICEAWRLIRTTGIRATIRQTLG